MNQHALRTWYAPFYFVYQDIRVTQIVEVISLTYCAAELSITSLVTFHNYFPCLSSVSCSLSPLSPPSLSRWKNQKVCA